jgi:hypothetical protein
MSGKAMQVAAPPAGTALRDVTRRIEEREGHVAEYAASLLTVREAFAAPKIRVGVIRVTPGHK